MFSIQPPSTQYTSLDEVGKFNMLWNVSLVLIPIFVVLSLIHIYFNDPSWTTSFTALVVGVVNLIILRRTRKYKVIGITSVVLGILISQAAIFLVNDSRLITDVMWCILVSFFSFFLFGHRWGTLVLLVNLSGLLFFLIYASNADVIDKGVNPQEVDYKMIINVYYVALALAFIIYKMLDNNKQINKRYEEQIAKNEVLLKEIHHRVKNNLQIISSLLNLQAAESTDIKLQEQFGEAINRIRSMALIHEKMYMNDDLAKIDIELYLTSLVQDISNSVHPMSHVDFKIDSRLKKIDIKNLVPISLIFNELITNSLKHGFNKQERGMIEIDIIQGNNSMVINYRDNGSWKEPLSKTTFGLELIKILTEQLDGAFLIDHSTGTHFQFKFDSKLFSAG